MKDDSAKEFREEFLGRPAKQPPNPREKLWKWTSRAVLVLALLFVMLQASWHPAAAWSVIAKATPPELQMYLPPIDK